MRLTRGSSLKGYAGFKKEYEKDNYTIIRPLITETKQEIMDYMDNLGLKYFIDESNFSDKYTRNRYRKNILPFLKKEDPNVHHKYLKFSEELINVNNFLETYISNLIKDISDEKGLKIDKLKELDNFLQIGRAHV